jgi:hypothetical protein
LRHGSVYISPLSATNVIGGVPLRVLIKIAATLTQGKG